MTSFGDIPPELLPLIGGGIRLLEHYSRARGVSKAWRAALPPPIPSLVTVTVTVPPPPGASRLRRHFPEASALFLPAGRSFPLTTLPKRSLCVGSSNGWLAVDARAGYPSGIYLVSRVSGGQEVRLLDLHNDGSKPVSKLVFAPDPRPDDYVAVAICGLRRLAYTKTRDMKWMVLDVAAEIGERDQLVDLAYDATGAGKVYCVTLLGDVHVLHIPQRQRRRPIVEPLSQQRAADAYPPPYDTASKFTSVKNVFVFGGDLYQVWRNAGRARSWRTPDGAWFVMLKDDVFVLRHESDPTERRRGPWCWDAVSDLGGYSVFVGKNQPVVLRPGEDAPGVAANCVYWMNEQSGNEPMVFDMATRTSTPLYYPSAAKALLSDPSLRSVGCWYFLDDKVVSEVRDNERKRRRLSIDHCEQQVSKSSRKAC